MDKQYMTIFSGLELKHKVIKKNKNIMQHFRRFELTGFMSSQ